MTKNGWTARAEQWAMRAAHTLEHHPRHVTALVAALMLGGAGGAFAVANSGQGGIDPSTLPVREVVESVESLPLATQSEALDVFRFNLYRTDASRTSDTAEALLARLGISDPAAAAFLRAESTFRTNVLGRPGRSVTAEADSSQALVRLSSRWLADASSSQFQRYVVERDANGRLRSRIENAPLVASLRLASGLLQTTYFDAMDDAGVSEAVAKQVLSIFEGSIDFNGGLRIGDRFNVVYETLEADGEPMRTGRVISTEFVNAGRMHQAMWYQEPGKAGGYFDLDGKSLERSFLASPMETTRITSGFARRFHPVLHQWKQHKGVDYGGAVGTPVRTIGDGKVRWAGPMGAYGNLVVIDHGDDNETYYAHLHRIDVRADQAVQKGQPIGQLGATGRVTGPHLHFEFRENGEHKDPMLALRNMQAPELSPVAKADFNRLSASMRLQFAAANNGAMVASAQ